MSAPYDDPPTSEHLAHLLLHPTVTAGPWVAAEASTYQNGQRVVTEHFVRVDGAPIAVASDVLDLDGKPCEDVADLLALAPALAAEVLRLRAERDALRAIIAGRTTPPTEAEMAAHAAADGAWLLRHPRHDGVRFAAGVPVSAMDARREWREGVGCIALDSQRRPCAWPSGTQASPRIPGCKTVGPCAYCDDPERAR